MKPSECNPRDWNLYYHGTYMLHDELGIVSISIDGEEVWAQTNARGSNQVVEPHTVRPFWPDPRAINIGNGSMYVGRRARREARRSATIHHYYNAWGDTTSNISWLVFAELYAMTPYPAIEEALVSLRGLERTSVAVSRDLILVGTTTPIRILCRGAYVGELAESNGRYEFIPEIESSPIARRILFKLQKEGILCLSTIT